ncbi:MAG: O-antigen ligase family protein [Burkholderiales bacterium]
MTPNLAALASLLCGAMALYKIQFIGEVYVAELLLLPAALLAVLSGGSARMPGHRLFGLFMLSLLVTLCGYILSDLLRGSEPEQFLRGWARIAFVGTDIFALWLLAARDRRNLWWFVLGLGAGGMIYLRLSGVPVSNWKFGYGVPVMLAAACMAFKLSPRFAALLVAMVGVHSIHVDSRVQGAVCLMVAAVVWVRGVNPRLRPGRMGRVLRLAAALGLAGLVVSALLTNTDDKYSGRRDASNFGRAVGVRAALAAIAQSPLIGWGSWSASKDLVRMSRDAIKEESKASGIEYYGPDGLIFGAHSQILQSWVEGGVLGMAFFAFFGFQLLRWLRYTVLERPVDVYSCIFLLYLTFQFWHLIQSPLGQNQRMHIATAAVIMILLSSEKTSSAARVTSPKTRAFGNRLAA